jgi:hypothetical protein
LKSDRLEGKSWTSFANINGLSRTPLVALLAEIAATGSDTLYIDGIDRIEKEHQLLVLDVLRAIVNSPDLSNWKIVVSLRDTAHRATAQLAIRHPAVTNPSALSKRTRLMTKKPRCWRHKKPALKPLLFGPAQVSEIARRPFFAKVLYQSFVSQSGGPPFEPQSEVDLIENWWTRGGYNAIGQEAIERQRALINIGSTRARQLSQPVPLSRLLPASINQLDRLVADGILQHVRKGHTIRFAHDIFFEWSFFHVLIEHGTTWMEELRQCGEPPAVARVVELLSQSAYSEGDNWAEILHSIADAKMRSQWTRAWLLGPIGVPTFENNREKFLDAVTSDNFAFLKHALVWFQAEKTVPNPEILASSLPPDQRIRAADFLSWPSDFAAWRRFIELLLERIDQIPASLYPHVVSVFEVWQNVLAGIRNPVSAALLTQCADWLREIDALHARKEPTSGSRWSGIEEQGDFIQSLCVLILRSAKSMPALAGEYLKRLIASDRLRDEKYKEVIGFSLLLASTHPQLLVDLTLKHLKDELPDDQVARERQELRDSAERRKRALAKPEAERTKIDKQIISGAFSMRMSHTFSYHDWERLCLDRDLQNFWPASPLREPFRSLFKIAPDFALKLFADLCNHAIAAWRQLHRHDYERRSTPIPLDLHFPWGVQQFWGGDREYLWCRGISAPHALASGFLALEEWCVTELQCGQPVDDLIRRIVAGNHCVAILGVAAFLILHTRRVSDTAFPIVTAQRLWFADLNRMVQETSISSAALIGFKAGDDQHIAAIKSAVAHPARKTTLQWLAPLYVFNREFGERTKATILAFKDNLPYQIEEHRNNKSVQDHLMTKALQYAELARNENYSAKESAEHPGAVEIVHVSPSASAPENVEKSERASLYLQQGNLWAWASQAFEKGKIENPSAVAGSIDLAKKLDDASLFSASDDEEGIGMRRGAVAAVAALILHFRDGRSAEELSWAREVLARAFTTPESRVGFWSAQSAIPWHQAIYVAHGLAADLRNAVDGQEARFQLLSLVGHPLEIVSLAALKEIVSLWDTDRKLVWAALQLAFDLCHLQPLAPNESREPNEPIHSSERVRHAIDIATEFYKHGIDWTPPKLPPPAWVRVGQDANPNEAPDFEFDQEDVEDKREAWAESPTHWYSQYAAKVLQQVPFEKILASEAKNSALAFVDGLLEWTNAKNAPPWLKKGRRDRESTNLIEWTHQLGETLGDISGRLPSAEVSARFLNPIFNLEGDTCWALLTPLASGYICRYIYDAQIVPPGAIEIVGACLERLLTSPSFERTSYRAGELRGFDEPRLAQILMFVSIERAGGAARFVNGDWSEIKMILPLVDRYVRAAGGRQRS